MTSTETDRQVDWDLLDRAVERITAENTKQSGLWNQLDWIYETSCGTGGCLAGHIVLLAYPRDSIDAQGSTVLVDGRRRSVRVGAETALGVLGPRVGPTGAERLLWDRLWTATNTLRRIRELVEDLKVTYGATS